MEYLRNVGADEQFINSSLKQINKSLRSCVLLFMTKEKRPGKNHYCVENKILKDTLLLNSNLYIAGTYSRHLLIT